MKFIDVQTFPLRESTCCVATKEKQLTAKEAGAEKIEMFLFEMQMDGYSPLHSHAGEHQIYVLEGNGQVFDGKKATELQQGDVLIIQSNEKHQIKNLGASPLRFLMVSPVGEE